MDIELARWLRRQTQLPIVLAANKCEGGNRQADYVLAAMGEAYQVGFGEAVAISAESGEVRVWQPFARILLVFQKFLRQSGKGELKIYQRANCVLAAMGRGGKWGSCGHQHREWRDGRLKLLKSAFRGWITFDALLTTSRQLPGIAVKRRSGSRWSSAIHFRGAASECHTGHISDP